MAAENAAKPPHPSTPAFRPAKNRNKNTCEDIRNILPLMKNINVNVAGHIPRNPMAPPVTQPLYTAFFQSETPLCCG